MSFKLIKAIWDFVQMLRGRKHPPKPTPSDDPFDVAIKYRKKKESSP
jgi:hypothetical protein